MSASAAAAEAGPDGNSTDERDDCAMVQGREAGGGASSAAAAATAAAGGGLGGGGEGPKSGAGSGSKWCNLDVVTLDELEGSVPERKGNGSKSGNSNGNVGGGGGAVRRIWKRVVQSVRSRSGRRREKGSGAAATAAATAAAAADVGELLTLYPPPVATTEQSKWIRGVPPPTGTQANSSSSGEQPKKLTIDDLMRWDFDPLSYPSEDLVPALSLALSHFDLPARLHLDVGAIDAFSRAVMGRHGSPTSVPYHNWHHGVSCLHVAFCLLTLGGASAYYPADDGGVEIFALLTAAIVHDVDHPGHNNDLEVKRNSDLARRYDGRAVLEANSVDVTFGRILPEGGPGGDIFRPFDEHNVDEEDVEKGGGGGATAHTRTSREAVMGLVRDLVLATDPAGHGDMVQTILAGVANDNADADGKAKGGAYWDRTDPSSRALLSRLIIHAADISNPASPDFAVARDWCQRISEEFRGQARAERAEGLPVTAFMDGLADEYQVARQQLGFYEYMALPLYRVIGLTLPDAAVLEGWARANLERFRTIVAAVDEWEEGAAAKKEEGEGQQEQNGEEDASAAGNNEL